MRHTLFALLLLGCGVSPAAEPLCPTSDALPEPPIMQELVEAEPVSLVIVSTSYPVVAMEEDTDLVSGTEETDPGDGDPGDGEIEESDLDHEPEVHLQFLRDKSPIEQIQLQGEVIEEQEQEIEQIAEKLQYVKAILTREKCLQDAEDASVCGFEPIPPVQKQAKPPVHREAVVRESAPLPETEIDAAAPELDPMAESPRE